MATTTTARPRTTNPQAVSTLQRELDAARTLMREAQRRLYDAAMSLLDRAAEAEALLRSDRRPRVSERSHVEHLLRAGGATAQDLDALAAAIAERPDLFAVTSRVLHRLTMEYILNGHWRTGTPATLETMTQACSGYNQDTAYALGDELRRVGPRVNTFVVAALAFRQANAVHPEAFGTLTREQDVAAIAEATALRDAVLDLVRSTPGLEVMLAEPLGVKLRRDANVAVDILHAAVAAQR